MSALPEAPPGPAPVDADGRRITERRLRRGLTICIVAGLGSQLWLAAVSMPWTMFLEALGATAGQIQGYAALAQAALAAQLLGALVGERLPVRKRFWATTAFVHRILWAGIAYLAWRVAAPDGGAIRLAIALAVLSQLLGHVATPLWHSWMADLVPSRLRGRFWAKRQACLTAALFAGVAASGWVLDWFAKRWGGPDAAHPYGGFAIVFLVAALAGGYDILLHTLVPEPKPRPVATGQPLWRRLVAPLGAPDFRRLTLALGVWTLASGFIGGLGNVYLRRVYHAHYQHLAAISMAGAVGSILAGLLARYAVDRVGARAFGAIMMLLGAAGSLLWLFLGDGALTLWGEITVPHAVAVQVVAAFVFGIAAAGVALTQLNLLGEHAPVEGRTMAMASHWVTVGLMGSLGPLVSGWVADRIDAMRIVAYFPTGSRFGSVPLLSIPTAMVMAFLGAPLLLRVKSRGLSFSDAVSRLVVMNPVRLLGSVYHIHTLGSSSAPREDRAYATRKLASHRSFIAVDDLLKGLSDPSVEVREASALSLGRLGTPEALRALLDLLADPACDIAPTVAKALRETPTPRATQALLDRLAADDDRQTRVEILRTLGRIRDPKALAAVRAVWEAGGDDRLAAAAAEAAARLSDVASMASFIPRYFAAGPGALKDALALAMGDLLAGRDAYYMAVLEEQDAPGRAVARLLRGIRRRGVAPEDLPVAWPLAARFESAYEDGDGDAAAQALLELGAVWLRRRRPLPGDPEGEAWAEALDPLEPRAAMAWRYWRELAREGDRPPRAREETLLGLVMLHGLSCGEDDARPAPRPG